MDLPNFFDHNWVTTYDTDTLLRSSLRLTALDESCTYQWLIDGREFTSASVDFDGLADRHPFKVNLQVAKKTTSSCLRSSELRDTLSRIFVYNSLARTYVNGRFRGYRNDNQADTTTITFTPLDSAFTGEFYFPKPYAYNLFPGRNVRLSNDGLDMALRMGQFGQPTSDYPDSVLGQGHSFSIYGNVIMDKSGHTKFDYIVKTFHTQNGKLIDSDSTHYTFTGSKISNSR